MTQNRTKDPSPQGSTLTADIEMVGHIEVSLEARIGTVTTTIGRLFELKAGDVVGMNEVLDAPVTLLLNGKAVARAELLAVEDHYGVRILEVS
ncbi:FliM/FliN family flagellar motor switch protein [Arenimonas terrae]|uniref:Flagellar motor switch protein FliN n=1 Tax=Arenimonas terrae TaxID=2546226 RepID=A0A5C4RRQ0_9GAMM|nr:FliM/FliN family flagellar motor switch protein [Arenimonas terrae]TNJ33227.1 hypothetical protein E1B00_13085 [Arenimonas terrae]